MPANYRRWIRKPTWYLNEAVALMLAIEPGQGISEYRDRDLYGKYADMLDTALRSEGQDLDVLTNTFRHPLCELFDTRYATVRPSTFLSWAKSIGYRLPEPLLPLLGSDSKTNNTDKDAPLVSPGSIKVIVDNINNQVTVIKNNGNKSVYSHADIVGKGKVTWDLLVDFAMCEGSLVGNLKTEVKKRNTSANRINLGSKLMDTLGLNESPIVKGRNGVMRFASITLAGRGVSSDALDRITLNHDELKGKREELDDITTKFLASNGHDMPPD